MDVSGQDSDWRSAAFRQKLVSQIDEAMRKAGVAHTKSSKDMESHVFMKAKSREEYLSLVARLIIHFRDIHNKKSQAAVGDPMNALQNLTGVASTGAPGMGMAVRPPGAQMGGMNSLGQMAQQMSLPGQQQQQPGTSVMAPHGMAGVAAPTMADTPRTLVELSKWLTYCIYFYENCSDHFKIMCRSQRQAGEEMFAQEKVSNPVPQSCGNNQSAFIIARKNGLRKTGNEDEACRERSTLLARGCNSMPNLKRSHSSAPS